ncbi:hypothetical protein [Kribbella sp. NPDC051770]|uniref:hypothetical protein n=1 Tax=Kribbella sp. NPDC051770 TaxID=3155413 RepID=UPI00344875A1
MAYPSGPDGPTPPPPYGGLYGQDNAVVGNAVQGDLTVNQVAPELLDNLMAVFLGLDREHVGAAFLDESHLRRVGLIQKFVESGRVRKAAQLTECLLEAAPAETRELLLALDKAVAAAVLPHTTTKHARRLMAMLGTERAAAVLLLMPPKSAAAQLSLQLRGNAPATAAAISAALPPEALAAAVVHLSTTDQATLAELLPWSHLPALMNMLARQHAIVAAQILDLLPEHLAADIIEAAQSPARILHLLDLEKQALHLTRVDALLAVAVIEQVATMDTAMAAEVVTELARITSDRAAAALLAAVEGWSPSAGPVRAAMAHQLAVHRLWPWWTAARTAGANLSLQRIKRHAARKGSLSAWRREIAEIFALWSIVRRALIRATPHQRLHRERNAWRAAFLTVGLGSLMIAVLAVTAMKPAPARTAAAGAGVEVPLDVEPSQPPSVSGTPSELRFPPDHPLQPYRGPWNASCRARWIEETVIEQDKVVRHRYRCTLGEGNRRYELVLVEYPKELLPKVKDVDRIGSPGSWTGPDNRAGTYIKYYQGPGRPALWLEEPAPSLIHVLLWAPPVAIGAEPVGQNSPGEQLILRQLEAIMAEHGFVLR